MTIPRVNPGGWAVNSKLTSAQQNQVDTQLTWALDKRSGQTDTLNSLVTVGGFAGITWGAASSLTTNSGSVATFNGTMTVNGAATFNGSTSLAGTTTAGDLTMTGTNNVKLASRSLTRVLSGTWAPVAGLGAWTDDASGGLQTSTNSTSNAVLPITLPVSCTITQVRVWLRGAGLHSWPIGTMPTLVLNSNTPSAGTTSVLGSATDGSGSAGSYQAPHAITITGSFTYDRATSRLFLLFVSESGANALSGLHLLGADVTFTPAVYDDGPTS